MNSLGERVIVRPATPDDLDITNHYTLDILTYNKVGPKNEVYLAPGQAIAFRLQVDTGQRDRGEDGLRVERVRAHLHQPLHVRIAALQHAVGAHTVDRDQNDLTFHHITLFL